MGPPLQVLYEDNHCLAVAKPGGLLTQGPEDVPTLEAQARAYLKEKYHKSGHVYLGIPHRLDRPVSGVVLFARSTKSAQRLAEQFRERKVAKVYVAVVEPAADGSLPAEQGEWRDWLRKIAEEARSEVSIAEAPDAREAVQRFQRLATADEGALLRLEPQTGRMHQLRIQSASRGWPIRGDALYGAKSAFGPPAELARDRLIALHGWSLTFLHPVRYEPVIVTAPIPDYWSAWARNVLQ
jgi:23S rRNA pseudouridine1911/1915/1917 synthase